MEIIGGFEAEVSCGNCGARLKINGSDIHGYTESRHTLPQYGEEPSYYGWDIYHVDCGRCGKFIEVSTLTSGLRLPKEVCDEVKAKRWR